MKLLEKGNPNLWASIIAEYFLNGIIVKDNSKYEARFSPGYQKVKKRKENKSYSKPGKRCSFVQKLLREFAQEN